MANGLVVAPCRFTFNTLARLAWCCSNSASTSTEHHNTTRTKCSASRSAVALDCEMVSCRPTPRWFVNAVPKKRKTNPVEVSVAGRCAVVSYDYKILFNSHIYTDYEITNWKGICPSKMESAVTLDRAREQILHLLRDRLVVGHDIGHDLASLQIHPDRHLPSRNIFDTSTCQILRTIARVPLSHTRASLKALALGVLKRRVQLTRPHDPVEDAMVTMELYRRAEEEELKKQGRL